MRRSRQRQRTGQIAERLAYWKSAVEEQKSKPRGDLPFSDFDAFCRVAAACDPLLYEAADFFDLDLESEIQKAVLLRILVDVVFAKPAKGRPKKHIKKWGRFRLVRLAVDLEKMKQATPNLSDSKAADLLKKKFPKRYQHNSAEMIRQKNLREARGWLDNARRIKADRRGLSVE
jgi:hypothetical protein